MAAAAIMESAKQVIFRGVTASRNPHNHNHGGNQALVTKLSVPIVLQSVRHSFLERKHATDGVALNSQGGASHGVPRGVIVAKPVRLSLVERYRANRVRVNPSGEAPARQGFKSLHTASAAPRHGTSMQGGAGMLNRPVLSVFNAQPRVGGASLGFTRFAGSVKAQPVQGGASQRFAAELPFRRSLKVQGGASTGRRVEEPVTFSAKHRQGGAARLQQSQEPIRAAPRQGGSSLRARSA